MGYMETILRFVRRVLSIIATILFCDLLLRISFVIGFFLMLPLFILHDHVIPSILLLRRSSRPITDIFFRRMLPSLIAFALSLLPPIGIYFFLKHILLPGSIKLFQLTW